MITPKDDGSLDPLALRPDPEYLEKYWGEWYSDLHRGKLPPRANHCAGDSEAGAPHRRFSQSLNSRSRIGSMNEISAAATTKAVDHHRQPSRPWVW